MSLEPDNISWDKLIGILEKPAKDKDAAIELLTVREREVLHWMQQLKEDGYLTGALQLNSRSAWRKTLEKMGEEAEQTGTPVRRLWISRKKWMVAACLLLLAGAYLLPVKRSGDEMTGHDAIAKALSGHTPAGKVQLITGDGHSVDVDTIRQLKEKDGTVIQSQGGQLAYPVTKEAVAGEGPVFNTLSVPRGYKYMLSLSDGSMVWLNADSRIRYPVHFDRKERRVEITGEAYLEVAHNPQWPFIVSVASQADHNRGGEVTVLGTSFDVKAYDQQIYATLVTGLIRFGTGTDKAVRLSPGQQAILDGRTGILETKNVFVEDWIAWKDDDLVMDKISLADLAVILERRYDVTIGFGDEKLKAVRYDGALHLTNNIVDILDNLEHTGNIRFALKDKKIMILPAS